jgi:hypothetical protein
MLPAGPARSAPGRCRSLAVSLAANCLSSSDGRHRAPPQMGGRPPLPPGPLSREPGEGPCWPGRWRCGPNAARPTAGSQGPAPMPCRQGPTVACGMPWRAQPGPRKGAGRRAAGVKPPSSRLHDRVCLVISALPASNAPERPRQGPEPGRARAAAIGAARGSPGPGRAGGPRTLNPTNDTRGPHAQALPCAHGCCTPRTGLPAPLIVT